MVLCEQDYIIYKETTIPYIDEEGSEDFRLQIFKEVNMVTGKAKFE